MIYTITLNPAVDHQLIVSEIEFNQVLRADEAHIDLGGKGLNVSRMLAELGDRSIAVGFVAGKNGNILQEGLQALGIETRFISVPGETRTNISIMTKTYDNYIKVNEPGAKVSRVYQEQLLELVRQLAQPDDWWVISGSLPPSVPPSLYAQIITEVQSLRANTILDASGEALRLGLKAGPTFVKPNSDEAAELTGLPLNNDDQVIEAAREIMNLGALNVIISLGKDGALLYNGELAWKAQPPTIGARNPIGAGDSLVAGLLMKLAQGNPLPTALKWGVACGAATASQEGTSLGSSTLVKSLFAQVAIEEISDAIHG